MVLQCWKMEKEENENSSNLGSALTTRQELLEFKKFQIVLDKLTNHNNYIISHVFAFMMDVYFLPFLSFFPILAPLPILLYPASQ